MDHFREAIAKGAAAQEDLAAKFEAYKKEFPEEAAEFERIVAGKLPDDWAADLPKWKPTDKPIATRVAGGAGYERAGKTDSEYHRRVGGSESFDRIPR